MSQQPGSDDEEVDVGREGVISPAKPATAKLDGTPAGALAAASAPVAQTGNAPITHDAAAVADESTAAIKQEHEPATAAAAMPPVAPDGMIEINLEDLADETRCPVCLGVIKDARLIAQCMHRFCAVCIEKWLRLSKENVCPQCRKPMQSRRDCKPDPRFDHLVAVLYNDVGKYEEQIFDASEEVMQKAYEQGAAMRAMEERRKAALPTRGRPPKHRSESPAPRRSDSPAAAASAVASGIANGSSISSVQPVVVFSAPMAVTTGLGRAPGNTGPGRSNLGVLPTLLPAPAAASRLAAAAAAAHGSVAVQPRVPLISPTQGAQAGSQAEQGFANGSSAVPQPSQPKQKQHKAGGSGKKRKHVPLSDTSGGDSNTLATAAATAAAIACGALPASAAIPQQVPAPKKQRKASSTQATGHRAGSASSRGAIVIPVETTTDELRARAQALLAQARSAAQPEALITLQLLPDGHQPGAQAVFGTVLACHPATNVGHLQQMLSSQLRGSGSSKAPAAASLSSSPGANTRQHKHAEEPHVLLCAASALAEPQRFLASSNGVSASTSRVTDQALLPSATVLDLAHARADVRQQLVLRFSVLQGLQNGSHSRANGT